jgi:hypothetical protein
VLSDLVICLYDGALVAVVMFGLDDADSGVSQFTTVTSQGRRGISHDSMGLKAFKPVQGCDMSVALLLRYIDYVYITILCGS